MPPLVVRPPGIVRLQPFALLATLLLSARRSPWVLALALPVVVLTPFLLRDRTTADDEGLVVRGTRRTTRVPWADVAALRRGPGGGVRAVRRDGTEVPLPWVESLAVVPERYVKPRSAQAVALRAQAAGWEIPLDA